MAWVIEHGAWAPSVESLGVLPEDELRGVYNVPKPSIIRQRRYEEFWRKVSRTST